MTPLARVGAGKGAVVSAETRTPSSDFRSEIRRKLPGLAERAKTQRCAAIRLFCVECMGGSARDAKSCETTDCFLWPHRGAAWRRP